MKKLLVIGLLVAGCAGGEKPTLKTAIAAAIVTTNAAYVLAVRECDAREKAIVARPVSTIEKDKADIAAVRQICDSIYAAFESARSIAPLVEQLEKVSK